MNDRAPYEQEPCPVVIDDAAMAAVWGRSDGRCECRSLAHGHDMRCNRQLVWPNRGQMMGRGAWRLRYRANGNNQPHIEVICAECAARDWASGA